MQQSNTRTASELPQAPIVRLTSGQLAGIGSIGADWLIARLFIAAFYPQAGQRPLQFTDVMNCLRNEASVLN